MNTPRILAAIAVAVGLAGAALSSSAGAATMGKDPMMHKPMHHMMMKKHPAMCMTMMHGKKHMMACHPKKKMMMMHKPMHSKMMKKY